MTSDIELLNRYATQRDEAAFAELVRRHLDHVYSTAQRLLGGDAQLAEDVTQTVFTDLARKARSLRRHASLSGWLHTSARFAAAKVVRGEQRRRQREQTALTMPATFATPAPQWEQLRPVLDQAIGELSDADRDALLLRYFEKKPFADIGAALGLSENAARMRVDRATDRLREKLAMRGITSTVAALGTALAQQAVGTAPAALAAQVVSKALACAAASSMVALTTGAKLALIVAAVLVVATLGVLVKPKPSPVPPASVAALAEGDANPTTQAAPHATFFERRQATQSNTAVPAPHGPQLFFVDDKTSQPITNRVIGLRGWERGENGLFEKKVQLEQGRCVAPFDPGAKPTYPYWILTRIEGYADVRLRWNPNRGDVIPDFYGLRLVRPALIGGQVVDATGNPVAGATVGFNTEELSGAGGNPEDHGIDYLTARTDARGHWQMNRFSPEMVRRLFGGASHPDYSKSEHIYVSRQPELERQLLEGTLPLHLHLGEGIAVSGEVVDQNGHPISNALAIVGVVDSSQSWNTRTGADGSFRIKGCQPGDGLVTAEADGFAPKVLKLKLGPRLEAVRLALGQGKALLVRVVDAAGNPVPGATLMLDIFPRGWSYYGGFPVPQVSGFSRDTDDQGRMAWTNAPEQPLPFGVRASGFMNTDVTLKPDGEEHLIALQAALVVYGTVRDAVTGELVPRFRLGIGWPQKRPDGLVEPQWSAGERFWPSFTRGEFRHTLQEGVIGGTPNPGYVFRFEAEGHVPFTTRVYQADEGQVCLDVQLRPAEVVRVLAYTPDGAVARDAQVASLVPGRDDVRLVPGGFAGPLLDALPSIGRVDSAGWFTVTDDGEIQRVVIVHPSGYAEATLDQLKKDHAVRLGRWATLEGVWQTNGQSVANAEITLQWSRRAAIGPRLDSAAFHTFTDAQGHFAFPQVPHGSLQIFAQLPNSPGSGLQKLTEVEVLPGEAKQVVIQDPLPVQGR